VWEDARASLDDEDCLVCIRSVGCGAVIGLAAELNEGVLFERLEADRRLCRR